MTYLYYIARSIDRFLDARDYMGENLDGPLGLNRRLGDVKKLILQGTFYSTFYNSSRNEFYDIYLYELNL